MKRLSSNFQQAVFGLWAERWNLAGGAAGFAVLVLIVKWIGGV